MDSELVCYLLDKIGVEETVEEIEGAYTLVWWDKSDSTINLMRNTQRPLVYAISENKKRLLFASESPVVAFGAAMHKTDKFKQIFELPVYKQFKANALRVSRILHIGSAACVTVAGFYGGFHWLYFVGYGVFVVLFYSYTKRFTALCHLVLGVGLSLAPIGAYLAVTGSFALLPLLFSFAVIFWVSGFDIIYALQDAEFDKAHQLNSIPAALGKKNALLVSRILHVCSAACVTIAGVYGDFHWLYFVGYGVFVGMLMNQHRLVKPNDLSKVNLAFMTSNGIASVLS